MVSHYDITYAHAKKLWKNRNLGVSIERANYLADHKSMAMTKRYDHANEERYGGAIEALDGAGKTGGAEALAAARWQQR